MKTTFVRICCELSPQVKNSLLASLYAIGLLPGLSTTKTAEIVIVPDRQSCGQRQWFIHHNIC